MMKHFIAYAIALIMACSMPVNDLNGVEYMQKEEMYVLDHENNLREVPWEWYVLMCQCVQTEGIGESNECQEAIATVILNRWLNPDKYPDNIPDVIFQENQFACDTSITEPDVGVRVAVHNAIIFYNTYNMCIPYQTYYFRADHYHKNLGIPYISIDNTYFSVDENAVLD